MRLLLGIGIGILLALGAASLRPADVGAARFVSTNQGGGVYTIRDSVSGACWLMVDRGDAAAVTTAPEKACQ